MKLTSRQKIFVDEYLKNLNATQAAIKAGYSEKTAGNMGAENLKKPYLQQYIQERQADIQSRNEITQDMIITELKKLGFANIDIDSIKASDKIKALELICKILGFNKSDDKETNNGMLRELIDGLKSL